MQLPIFENYRTVMQPFEERKWGEHENGEKWERKEKRGGEGRRNGRRREARRREDVKRKDG